MGRVFLLRQRFGGTVARWPEDARIPAQRSAWKRQQFDRVPNLQLTVGNGRTGNGLKMPQKMDKHG